MRRLIPAIAAVLLTTACSSSATHAVKPPAPTSTSPSLTISASPSPSVTAAPPSPTQQASATTSPTPSSTTGAQTTVAVHTGALPYKPAPGAPALDDVSIRRTATDSCVVPADDSGNEAQLLNATMDGTVLIVTFEVTNPCPASLRYDLTVTQALGSSTGTSGGPDAQAVTPEIPPGASISFRVNVDPKPSLSRAQLQQLWVGVTRISKEAA